MLLILSQLLNFYISNMNASSLPSGGILETQLIIKKAIIKQFTTN